MVSLITSFLSVTLFLYVKDLVSLFLFCYFFCLCSLDQVGILSVVVRPAVFDCIVTWAACLRCVYLVCLTVYECG